MSYILVTIVFLLNGLFFKNKKELVYGIDDSIKQKIKTSLLIAVYGLIIPYAVSTVLLLSFKLDYSVISTRLSVAVLLLFSFVLFNYRSFKHKKLKV